MNLPFSNLLEKTKRPEYPGNLPKELNDARTEGDGTEWIIEKDGKLFKRAIGSHEKIYLEDK